MSRCKFFFLSFLIIFVFALPSYSQSPLICSVSGTPLAVRAEGLAERLGDVVLGCSGGAPGLVVTGNLTVQLNVPFTNRLSAGTPGDIILTVDTGSGHVPVTLLAEQLQTPQVVSLNGFSFTIPPSGNLTVRISNLRGSVVNAPPGQVVIATLALNNLSTMTLINNSVVVGVPQRGLLTNSSSTTIRCFGSPVPGTVTMTNLFLSGTHFESTRLTEGFASAFQARASQDDAGTRFIIRYTNIPAGIMLFVPDFIAGSDALQPTAGGDLGTPQDSATTHRVARRCCWRASTEPIPPAEAACR